MERFRNLWNSKYFRAGLVGAIVYLGARLFMNVLPELLNFEKMPAPNLLSLLLGYLAGYLVARHYRY